MGCKETLPISRASGEGNQETSATKVFCRGLRCPPFSRRNPAPASLAPAVGLVVAGVHQPWQPVGGPGEEAL